MSDWQSASKGSGGGRGGRSLPIRGGRDGYRGDRRGGGRGGRGDGGGYRGGDRGRGRGRRGFGGAGVGGEVTVYSQEPGTAASLDKSAAKVENETAVAIQRTGKKGGAYPLRPGYGVMGKEVLLWANYFPLTNGNLTLYRYSMDISETGSGRAPAGKRAKRVVQLLMEEEFAGQQMATDYRSTIISRRNIEMAEEYAVIYRTEGEDDPAPEARHYKIKLHATGTLAVSELVNHLNSPGVLAFAGKDEVLQALNIVVGHHPKASASVVSVGANRHFDNAADRMSLGAGLQAVRGLFVSVRAATARLLVNVQVKNMAFYEEGPLEDIMRVYTQANGPNRVNLAKFLKRLSIDVTHIVKTNKAGRRVPRLKSIQGLATKDDGRKQAHPPIVPQFGGGAKDVQFWLEDVPSKKKSGPAQAKYVTVADFFRLKYNITVKDTSLPVVNVGTRDSPSYLPAQVCQVRPGQPAVAKLSPNQTAQMIKFAVRRPLYNARDVASSTKLLSMTGFDMSVMPKMISVPGRVLQTPDIKYAANGQARPRFGSWNMQSVQFIMGTEMPRWTYLRISVGRPPQSDKEFLDKMDGLQRTLQNQGIRLNRYMAGQHVSGNPTDITEALHKFAINKNRPTLVLVILPSENLYSCVKTACDVHEGLLNVCVLDHKFARANDQYFANVGLKFNLKLGGRNHSVKTGLLSEKKTMVVGIDVTHPSPGSTSNAPSVAGIVASVDEWLSQWPADLRIQTARQEKVDDLDEMFKSRLRLWERRNGRLPENLLVYRDGVSEGQYDMVLREELPQLQHACKQVYPANSKPRITIAVVGKRHHTRFYATSKDDADRSGNPQNGTVVDRGVTEARNWDFYLQAHTAIQGTARPAHYYIVYDEIFAERKVQMPHKSAADAFEELTHNMCYLFGRATKAVSICPPAYYADLLCERARCYMSEMFAPSPLTSPTASVATSTGVPDACTVRVHENVRDAMFYV